MSEETFNDGAGEFSVLDAKKHGIGGVVHGKLEYKEQDATAEPEHGYAVVFFPRLKNLGPAEIWRHTFMETFSQSAELAIAKFMDGKKPHDSWQSHVDAGWKVRRVTISDAGDPAAPNAPGAD